MFYIHIFLLFCFIIAFSLFAKYRIYGPEPPPKFIGHDWWDNDHLALCDDVTMDKTFEWKHAVCFEYLQNFQIVKVEVVAWRPGLVIYRDLFTGKQMRDYLELMEHLKFEEQLVVNDDGNDIVSKIRRANGTQVFHEDHPAAQSIWDTAKNLLPNLNFKTAEDIMALSYNPGGHYAAHHDYLLYPSENEWDEWMRVNGNRFGTLIMAFGAAESGGATVFPRLGAAIRTKPGDAFFWFNAMGNSEQEDLSEHAGCPIYKGQKQISTIWLRMRDQPILEHTLNSGSISASLLFPGEF